MLRLHPAQLKSIAPAGGQPLTLYTHSSTGKGGQPLRLFEDLVEIGLGAALEVQVP